MRQYPQSLELHQSSLQCESSLTGVTSVKSYEKSVTHLPASLLKRLVVQKQDWFGSVNVPYLSLEEFSGTFHHFLITRLFTTHFTKSKEENHCPALIHGLKYPRTFQITLFVCILIWTLSKLSNMLCHSLTSFGKPNISWWFYQDVMCKLWAKTLKGPGILNFSAMWKLHKEQLLQNS